MTFTDNFTIPSSLLIYEILNVRRSLSLFERRQYERLQKGFAGEKRLAHLINRANYEKFIPLYDSLFVQAGTEFQIDCLLLTGDTAFLLEVKNYTNDYILKNGKIYNHTTKKEINNPIRQLERTEYLFKNMLNQMKSNINIRPYIVFINPEFTLYGATPNLSMILPSQVRRFLNKINANALAPNEHTLRLAENLARRRKNKSAYEQVPEYEWSELRKGIFCERCSTELRRKDRFNFTCHQCQANYQVDHILLDAINQFHLLFPEEHITTGKIHQWCGGEISSSFIRKHLRMNFKIVKNGRYTHYIIN